MAKFLEPAATQAPASLVDHQLNQFSKDLAEKATKPNVGTINISSGKIDLPTKANSSTPEKPREAPSKIRLPKNLTRNVVKNGEDASEASQSGSGIKTRSSKSTENGVV